MKCPVCDDIRMREVEKNGVLIDVCPECKGVWLDRGELEKLMSAIREVQPAFNEWYERQEEGREYDRRDDEYRRPYSDKDSEYDRRYPSHGKDHRKKKKKSVLDVFGDLFD